MKLKFSKMHGLGNDFVVLDGVRQQVSLSTEQIRALGDRHRGVGFDQMLLVEPAQTSGADFRYRIFNADGSEVEQCGNGARCFVRFVHDQGLTEKSAIVVETKRGIIHPRLEADGLVTVDMGQPRFKPDEIPFVSDTDAPEQPLVLEDGTTLTIGAVSMGNPHAVQRVQDIDAAPIAAAVGVPDGPAAPATRPTRSCGCPHPRSCSWSTSASAQSRRSARACGSSEGAAHGERSNCNPLT